MCTSSFECETELFDSFVRPFTSREKIYRANKEIFWSPVRALVYRQTNINSKTYTICSSKDKYFGTQAEIFGTNVPTCHFSYIQLLKELFRSFFVCPLKHKILKKLLVSDSERGEKFIGFTKIFIHFFLTMNTFSARRNTPKVSCGSFSDTCCRKSNTARLVI